MQQLDAFMWPLLRAVQPLLLGTSNILSELSRLGLSGCWGAMQVGGSALALKGGASPACREGDAAPILAVLGLLRAHFRTRWWRRWASAAATPCGSTFRRS